MGRNEEFGITLVKGPKIDFAVTQCYFERPTSLRCQSDRTGMLNSDFESKCQCDTWRSFSLDVGLSDRQIHVAAKITAKCP